ncbi:CBS domain-containing protein [Streptomyces sp. NPDC003719]
MRDPETGEAGRAPTPARRAVPSAVRPAPRHRQDFMVRYLQAMASHSAGTTAEDLSPEGGPWDAGGPRVAQRPTPDVGLQVSDIMKRSSAVPAVTADTPYLDIARTMARRQVGAVPVTDDERHVVGVVAESDLLARAAAFAGAEQDRGLHALLFPGHARSDEAATAAALMTAPAVTVRPWTTVVEAARRAARSRVRQIFVTDHHDRLIGVVSRNELLHALVRDDTAIHDEIVARVLRELGIPAAQVRVRVRNGTVTLTGALKSERIAALTGAVERIADVNEVEDLLTEI